ncbi:MAG TPA: hypothetical protein VFX85_09375 [Solirubrobacterales bacterium]|nr:hypothetical protein [Solirubrobacterales bacterium]
MTSQGWVRRGSVAVLAAAAMCLLSAPGASADSGSLSVSDDGGGLIAVKAEATRSACGEGLCAWYAAVVERHASLPCANDLTFRAGVAGFSTDAGTVRKNLTFKPFFPRQAKLCLYVLPVVGKPELVAETTYKVPDGYGSLRSTQKSCAGFESQAAAQYYLYLYPDDPSRLDSDRNGTVCEENPCPCEAEPIPAEPRVKADPAPCNKARAKQRQAQAAVGSARRQVRKADSARAKQRWNRSLKKRQATLRKAKTKRRQICAALAAQPYR